MKALLVTAILILSLVLVVGPGLAPAADIKINTGGVQIQTGPSGPSVPPPQAPAYGARAKQIYNYYPGANCYFEPTRGLYFYYANGTWQAGVSLPDSLKIKLGDAVSLELDTDKPYIYNPEHVKKYPPGQAKKMGTGGEGNQGGGFVPPGQAKKHKK